MIGKPKRKITEPRASRPVPTRWKVPVIILIRMFLLGSIAVVACAWAIWRYYTTPRTPMVVPVTPPASGEIEIEPP